MATMNRQIRLKARGSGVSLQKLADEMGIGIATLYRHLNRSLSQDERRKMFDAIRAVAERFATEGK